MCKQGTMKGVAKIIEKEDNVRLWSNKVSEGLEVGSRNNIVELIQLKQKEHVKQIEQEQRV